MQSGARSFGQAAAAYDAIRPTYPVEAVVWALGAAPLSVLDLGAGTGILTRVLLAAGHRVTAVEPDEQMCARLAAATPGTVPVAGSAEEIPLPDGSVDAVTAGQAYHWFDPRRAHLEIARVLRAGGVFAPIWNMRNENVPWVAELTRVASLGDGSHRGEEQLGDLGDRFGPAELAQFRHCVAHTPESLLALVRSRSYYLTSTPVGRARIDDGVCELMRSHPDLAGRERFELPYVTDAYRAVRL